MEATRATIDAVKSKMQRYRTTRKLLSVLDRPPKSQGALKEDRQSLELQRTLTLAASCYGTAIESAFEALLTALEALERGGLKEVDSAVPIADGLMKGLFESHAIAKDMVRSMMVPLEVHAAAISECFAGLAEAEQLAAELKRYHEKVESLAEESEHSEGDARRDRAEARLARNRAKLRNVQKAAQEAEAEAEAKVKSCLAKRASLDELVHSAIRGTAEALRMSVAHAPLADGKKSAKAAAESTRENVARPPREDGAVPPPVGSLNPFDGDIIEPGHSEEGPGARSPRRSAAGNNPFEAETNPFDEDIQEEKQKEAAITDAPAAATESREPTPHVSVLEDWLQTLLGSTPPQGGPIKASAPKSASKTGSVKNEAKPAAPCLQRSSSDLGASKDKWETSSWPGASVGKAAPLQSQKQDSPSTGEKTEDTVSSVAV